MIPFPKPIVIIASNRCQKRVQGLICGFLYLALINGLFLSNLGLSTVRFNQGPF